MALLSPTVRTPFLLAILFIILGTCNLVFGGHRADEYYAALLKVNQVVEPAEGNPLLPQGGSASDTRDSKELRGYPAQLRARFDFYTLVAATGKWMLAVAGFFLLLSLVALADAPDESEMVEK